MSLHFKEVWSANLSKFSFIPSEVKMDLSKMKFDIIIQGGQSNAEGYVIGEVLSEYQPKSNIFYLEEDRQIESTDKVLLIAHKPSVLSVQIADEKQGKEGKIGDFSLTFA